MFKPSRWKTVKTVNHLARLKYSTTPQSFPFPKHSNPSPHQIFHLPSNASQDDIKNRYYELVRIYHPDKTGASISSEDAHTRFQSISDAYNILRGKSTPNETIFSSPRDRRQEATTAARRAAYVRRHRELYEGGAVDERWKDRIIFFGVLGTVILFVAQAAMTRQAALEEAMENTRLPRDRIDSEINSRKRKFKTFEDPRLSEEEPKR